MITFRKITWTMAVVAIALFGFSWATGRLDNVTPINRTSVTESFPAQFELTDHNGMVQSNNDFPGQWLLVFFGFTNCPDVCPMGLSTIAQVMDDLGPTSDDLQPLFITIDPERDTPSVMAEYVPQFSPRILGLSGSAQQIKDTAKAFKVFYQRNEEETAPDGYTMGHTSSFLLFNPEGAFVTLYEYDQEPAKIVTDLQERIGL